MARKTLFYSLVGSIKDLAGYFEEKFPLPAQPTASRWGIVSTLSSLFSSAIALGVGFWAISIAIFGGIWGCGMGIAVIVLGSMAAILGIFLVAVGIWGLVKVHRLAKYWIENPWESDTDKLIRGIAKGAAEEGISGTDASISKIEKFGIKVGKYAVTMMAEKGNNAEAEESSQT